MNKLSALILAGGKGRRMGLLCESKPKPALPFGAHHRVIDFSLSNCLNSCLENVAVLTGFQRSFLARYIKRWYSKNAPDSSITILDPYQGNYKGTADAVFQNLQYVSRQASENVLVLAADHVYKMDYREMIKFHEDRKADVTVAVVKVPIEKAHQFGAATVSMNAQISHFIEKPQRPESNLVSMGIYVFRRSSLYQRLIEDAMTPQSVHDFGHSIIPRMVKQDRVYAYEFQNYWQDIGTPEAYHRANLDLLSEASILRSNSAWPVLSAEIHRTRSATVHDSRSGNNIIGANCVIKGSVENSILSSGVWIGQDAVVRNSVIMSNASVGRGAIVTDAILDEGAGIPEYRQIGMQSSSQIPQPGITVLGQNSPIPTFESRSYAAHLEEQETEEASIFDLEDILQFQLDPTLS